MKKVLLAIIILGGAGFLFWPQGSEAEMRINANKERIKNFVKAVFDYNDENGFFPEVKGDVVYWSGAELEKMEYHYNSNKFIYYRPRADELLAKVRVVSFIGKDGTFTGYADLDIKYEPHLTQ